MSCFAPDMVHVSVVLLPCQQVVATLMLRFPVQVLAPYAKDININTDVMDMYLRQLLPGITRAGDDGNYGSCACYDVLCLQVC